MKKVEIIAEAAQGYEGDGTKAILLAQAAIKGNADSIKFQIVYADELSTPDYKYYKLFKKLEMDLEVWKIIAEKVKKAGKKLYFDVYGNKSLETAIKLKANGVKIATTEFYNDELFNKCIRNFSRIFISTGGIPFSDIKKKVKIIPNYKDIVLLYGYQAEPTKPENNNLNRINYIKEHLKDVKIGFMDHTEGGTRLAYHIPILAIGMGAEVIEKHISLDRELEMEDFISALSPSEFKEFTGIIREAEKAMGKKKYELTKEEIEYRAKATKIVVAIKEIKKGAIIKRKDIELKRTGEKINRGFYRIEEVIGKKLIKDKNINEPLKPDDIK